MTRRKFSREFKREAFHLGDIGLWPAQAVGNGLLREAGGIAGLDQEFD